MLVGVADQDGPEEGGLGTQNYFVSRYLTVITDKGYIKEIFLFSLCPKLCLFKILCIAKMKHRYATNTKHRYAISRVGGISPPEKNV
jgi:hypothetical protein